MRVGFILLALIIVVFAGAPGGFGSATRTAFAQSQQPRNQTQSSEGLPEREKNRLSRLGPEDVFPIERDNTDRTTRGQQQQQRGLRSTSTSPSSPTQRTPATSAPTPSAATSSPATSSAATSSAAPIQPPVETPSPAIGAVASDSGVQSPLIEDDSAGRAISKWRAYALIAMALIVSAALIFTVTKLWEKIRESSAG